jgi:hypothetical protein
VLVGIVAISRPSLPAAGNHQAKLAFEKFRPNPRNLAGRDLQEKLPDYAGFSAARRERKNLADSQSVPQAFTPS